MNRVYLFKGLHFKVTPIGKKKGQEIHYKESEAIVVGKNIEDAEQRLIDGTAKHIFYAKMNRKKFDYQYIKSDAKK